MTTSRKFKEVSFSKAKEMINNKFYEIKNRIEKEPAIFEGSTYEGSFNRNWTITKNKAIDARYEKHMKYDNENRILISEVLRKELYKEFNSEHFALNCLSTSIFKMIKEDKSAGHEVLINYMIKINEELKKQYLQDNFKEVTKTKKLSI